jgi:hypothetical protein
MDSKLSQRQPPEQAKQNNKFYEQLKATQSNFK